MLYPLSRIQAHVYLHLVTGLVYRSPQSWVTARLLARLLDDALQRDVYDAQLLGTSYSFSATETGFSLHVQVSEAHGDQCRHR